jgi:hemoglobin-like flavoprotein
MSLKMMKDEETFKKSMHELTVRHNARGVRSIEYAFACEALFWALDRVCGDSYNESTRRAWVKILSKMLKYIIPDSITYEVSMRHKKTPADAETQISPATEVN